MPQINQNTETTVMGLHPITFVLGAVGVILLIGASAAVYKFTK